MYQDMDKQELVAQDLETAQQKRYTKAGCSDEFWDHDENEIFEDIKRLRSESKTYDPLNAR